MNFAFLEGCCEEMCPLKEKKLRRRTKKRHKLEVNNKDHNDDKWMVKEYSRSAAGRGVEPSDLRTSHTLLSTALHLIKRILPRQDVPFIDRYFFIFDRLRAVRQDASIQCLHDHHSITTLIITIRFLIFVSHVLRHHKHYDDNINNTLLNQCILTAVDIITNHYEEEVEEEAVEDSGDDNDSDNHGCNGKDCGDVGLGKTEEDNKYKFYKNNDKSNNVSKTNNINNKNAKNNIANKKTNNKNESNSSITKMAAVLSEVLNYHVLNNLNTPHAVTMAMQCIHKRRNIKSRTTVKLWLEYNKQNYHRVMKLFHRLSFLQQCLVYQHMPSIRRNYIVRLAHTFIGKNNHYSLDTLSTITHPSIHLSTILPIHPSDNQSSHTPEKKEKVSRTHNTSRQATISLLSSLRGISIDDDKVIFDKKALDFSDDYADDYAGGVSDGVACTFVENNVVALIFQ